jgi:hypothetical protein
MVYTEIYFSYENLNTILQKELCENKLKQNN